MTVHVSNLTHDDRSDWEQLYHGYAKFYKVPMNKEILDTVWGWIHDPDMRFFGIAARDSNGKPIGMMHYREMPSPLRGKYIGFLDDLFILPESRGTGAVDALFATLKNNAAFEGWSIVRWITAENNYRGRGAYDKLSEKTHWATYQMSAE